MPVDRSLGEDLARALVDVYSELETDIARVLARRISHDITDVPADALNEKLGSVNDLRNAVQRLLNRLERGLPETVEQQLVLAFQRGGAAALDELARLGGLDQAQLAAIRASLPGAEAINALVWPLVTKLQGTHLQVLRWPQDVYRSVVASVLPHGLAGTATRLGIAQRAYGKFLERGVTGFTDRAGRNWQLSSYVEMAARTGLMQAAVQGHLDRLGAAGLDLVQVSDSPQECHLCRPWEGKVLHRGVGESGWIEVEHAIHDGQMVRVHVAGSVVEAILAGLFHPNCRHSINAYLPGVTKPKLNTEDPEGDKARRQQRAIERGIRAAKVQAAGAMTTGARQDADRRIRSLQERMREHLNAHPELNRLRYREQIGAGNIPGPRLVDAPAVPARDLEAKVVSNRVEPARAPESPARVSPADRVAQLLTQEPADVRKLTGGQTADVDLATYPDGSRLVRKSNANSWRDEDEQRELTDAEELSPLVLDALGLRAAAVARTGPASVAMEYIDGRVGAELVTDEFTTIPADILDSPDGRLLGLADYLRGEVDRNLGGWIVDPAGRIVGVDNGFSTLGTNSVFANYLFKDPEALDREIGDLPFTPADMARVRERLQALRPRFEQLGRGDWFTAMMDRLTAVEAGATGTTDRIL